MSSDLTTIDQIRGMLGEKGVTHLKNQALCVLAQSSFYHYCQALAPDFYRDDRPYIVHLCDELQAFLESDDIVLVLNTPPRFGKSRTASLLITWILGRNPSLKTITASYNKDLSTTFSQSVRDTILAERNEDDDHIVYSDIFPKTKIKQGDGAVNRWSVEGGFKSYLATSPNSAVTGFGGDIIVFDDIIKNAMEAYNETIKDSHWEWFRKTMFSRTDGNDFKIIIIMTRWATDDLAGRLIDFCNEHDVPHRSILYKAKSDDGILLCEDILDEQKYNLTRLMVGEDIFSANYQQEPIDLKNRLYSSFKTYEKVPQDENGNPLFTAIKAYVDTADLGTDYLCMYIYGVFEREAYILDAYYTQDPMEITELEVARRLHDFEVNICDIESNNGGRGFARSVESILDHKYYSNKTKIQWFHQSRNKVARILSNSTWVMNHIYFPVGWELKWGKLYSHLSSYQATGKNAHDDAPDALTGVAEKCGNRPRYSFG